MFLVRAEELPLSIEQESIRLIQASSCNDDVL